MQNKKFERFIVGLTGKKKDSGSPITLNAWMEIGAGNQFTFFIPRAEMGQGVYTALTTLICEELDIHPNGENIRVTHPDALLGVYSNYGMLEEGNIEVEKEGIVSWMVVKVFNKYPLIITGASTSVLDAWNRLRLTGAQTRWQFIQAASRRWDVSSDECTTKNGFVLHEPSDRRESYFELAPDACRLTPPEKIPLKENEHFKYIGKDIKRLDIPSKVDGSAIFGIDIEMTGMLYAAIRHAPVLGTKINQVDEAEVAAISNIEKVVHFDNWVAVIADSFWTAKNALAKLKIIYTQADEQPINTETIRQLQEETLLKKGKKLITKKGSIKNNQKKACILLSETFHTPYLAHAPMEPLSATARYEDGVLEIWQSTQSSTATVLAANRAGKAAKVKIKETIPYVGMVGGGFGIKGELDVTFQACYLAIQCPGRPVKLIWPREEDIKQDKYRPGVISRFEVGLDEKGYPLTWANDIAGQSLLDSLLKRSFGLPIRTGRLAKYKFLVEGANHLYYSIPHQRVRAEVFETPIQLGFWRSVGHSNNAYFVESMVDICAEAANIDPFSYRKNLLKNHPRLLNVLNTLEDFSHSEKESRGVAIWHSFQSNIGVTATASYDPQNHTVTIPRVYCVVDCGTPVNPDNIINQMEGSVIFALSAFYFGEITLDQGKIVQSNFNDYKMAKLCHTPEIKVHIIDSTERPGGMGEPGVPASIAAMANAVSKATGIRITELPIIKMGIKPMA